MTEEDAKKKWCPFVSAAVAEASGDDAALVSFNRIALRNSRNVQIPAACKCLGSACMAWRSTNPRVIDVTGWSQDEIDNLQTAGLVARGFCGLAGVPQ